MQSDPLIPVEVDENENTEWNDILRQKGIIPEKPPSPSSQTEEALEEALQKQYDNRLEGKDLSDLDELEDEEDEEFLVLYRQKRLKEIADLQRNSKFGEVFVINKPDYHSEITEASKGNVSSDQKNVEDVEEAEGVYVFVHLALESKLQSRLLAHLFRLLAPKYPEIKFVEISASRAVENYPDSNCPTLLVYYKGDILKNLITLLELGGNNTTPTDLEDFMVRVGALDNKDSRLITNQDDEHGYKGEKLKIVGKMTRSGICNKSNSGAGITYKNDGDDDFFE